MTKKYEAYCFHCAGGGKTLGTFTSKKRAWIVAQSHNHLYGCDVEVLDR